MKCDIKIKASHLIIPAELAKRILQQTNNVYVCYKEDQDILMVSPEENTWFPKLHSSQIFMVKSKDLAGTKSIAIREVIIDHEIDDCDRNLPCIANDEKKFLRIELG